MKKTNRIISLPSEFNVPSLIEPVLFPWAIDLWDKANANNWRPTEIPMGKDIAPAGGYPDKLIHQLGFFAGTESLVANNLLLVVFRWIMPGELRQYIIRQAFEEALHNETITYVCSSLGLDRAGIFSAWQDVPTIAAKDQWLMDVTDDVDGSAASVIRAVFCYYILCEGILFYSGFALILRYRLDGLFPGICQQIDYTLRDESLHIEFGIKLLRELDAQHPGILELLLPLIDEAVKLEDDYIDAVGEGEQYKQYIRYIADRRRIGLGFDPVYHTGNPFPWMTTAVDLVKEKNFFETRVTDYRTGIVDDF